MLGQLLSPRAGSPARVPSSAQARRLSSARLAACECVRALIYSLLQDWGDEGQKPVSVLPRVFQLTMTKFIQQFKKKLHTINIKTKMEEMHLAELEDAVFSPYGW